MILVTPMGQRYALLIGDNVIGRGADCDLRLRLSAVSRRHAVVRWDGEEATITDLGSTNGTILNGEQLAPHRPYALQAGDRLELAGAGGRLEVRPSSRTTMAAVIPDAQAPEPGPAPTALPQPQANPYVGPRAFQRGERLYGREYEVAELLDLIIAERIVLLYSPSGAGKTSLIQAALIPELEQEGFRVLPPLRVSLEPGPARESPLPEANRYVLSLILSLEETLPAGQQMPLEELAAFDLDAYLDHRRALTGHQENTILILDQFEEILTVDPTDREAKAEFFDQLGQALRDRGRWALLAMREEFLASLDPFLRPLPTRLSNTYRLELLGPDAAREAIQEPAEGAGIEFTSAAATKLIDDLRQIRIQLADGSTEEQAGAHVEPVQLQVVCRRLWERLPPTGNRSWPPTWRRWGTSTAPWPATMPNGWRPSPPRPASASGSSATGVTASSSPSRASAARCCKSRSRAKGWTTGPSGPWSTPTWSAPSSAAVPPGSSWPTTASSTRCGPTTRPGARPT